MLKQQQQSGTVYGGGYNCKTGKTSKFEGEEVGIWNKVSEIARSSFLETNTKLKAFLGFCTHRMDPGSARGEGR